jgi:hypothetical protein
MPAMGYEKCSLVTEAVALNCGSLGLIYCVCFWVFGDELLVFRGSILVGLYEMFHIKYLIFSNCFYMKVLALPAVVSHTNKTEKKPYSPFLGQKW